MKNIKKAPTFILCALFSFGNICSAQCADWEIHWAADYIASARKAGWADMREKSNFAPSDFCSREEAVYMICASQLNFNENIYIELSNNLFNYSDIDEITPKYLNAFRILVGNGIIGGNNEGKLRPKDYITRAEMAVTISALIPDAVLTKAYDSYNDEIPQWALLSVERCSRAGLISGYPDGTFRAQNYISRGEAVRMIQSLREFQASMKPPADEIQESSETYETDKSVTSAKTQSGEKSASEKSDQISVKGYSETAKEESTEIVTEEYDPHTNNMQLANEMLSLMNDKRFEKGSSTLKIDQTLCDLAFLKAKDMYKTKYNQVYSTTYGELTEVLANAGIKYMQQDMVIASGVSTARDALSSFETNSEYDNIILDSNFTRIGVGVYEDRWAVIFVRIMGD